jgi:D-glycero-D-manno-heptose 1,7-bisphosphate phosphatase
MVNQAVILCGGLGKRLMPLTKHTPKPMVKINKKPFLEYLIYQLKSNGLTNILILGGYRSDKIKNYFQNGKNFGVKIEYSNGPIDWDTGTRVFKAQKKLNKFFLLLYSDNIFSFNFQKIKKNFDKEKNINFILKKKEIGNFSIFKDEIKSYSIKRSKKKIL